MLPIEEPPISPLMGRFSLEPEVITAEIRALPVTYEPLPLPEDADIAAADLDVITDCFHEAQKGTPYTIRTLKRLIRKYPSIVSLKNHLTVAYSAAGRDRAANLLNKQVYEEHPDYLFGRINQASLYLTQRDKLDRIPEILGETLCLGDLQPDREVFHFSEIKGFYNLVALYHLRCGRVKPAMAIHEFLEGMIGSDDPTLQQLHLRIAHHNITRLQDHLAEEKGNAIRVEVANKPEGPAELFPPGFNHPEIEDLYRFEFDLPRAKIEEILALPRPSLIADLEAVLRDCLERGSLYLEERINFEDEETCFPLHAIFLLGALKAGESLPVVLEILSRPPDALEFWFGELLSTNCWEPLHHLVEDRLDETREWMLSPGIPGQSRDVLAEAAAQIVLHQPDRREEVLDWFRHILDFLLHSPPEDNVLDTDLVTGMVWHLMDIRGVELLPLITAHFEKNHVARTHVGDLEEITESLSEPPRPRDCRPLLSVPNRYRKILNPAPARPPDPKLPVTFPGADALGRLLGASSSSRATTTPKVGRNDPCPCGSGKKYKKCCLE